MQASDTCLTAIKGWEGCAKWDGTAFRIYLDLNNYPTIGWGHKLIHNEIVTGIFSSGIAQAQAAVLFLSDIAPVDSQVDALGLTLTQGQYDALVSFNFNLGINDTKIMLSHGIAVVPQQIPRWIYAAGVVQPGLVTRRETEVSWWQSQEV
jgi:lysozyme